MHLRTHHGSPGGAAVPSRTFRARTLGGLFAVFAVALAASLATRAPSAGGSTAAAEPAAIPASSPRAIAPEVTRGSPAATPAPAPGWPITIAVTGDIMLGRGIEPYLPPESGYGPFAGVRDRLLSPDITIGNLESALTDRGEPEPKGYTFRAPPGPAAARLREAGFDAVALANNHTLDYGTTGLTDTRTALANAGIAAPGAGTNAAEARQSAIIERRGVRIAVLSFAEVPNEGGYSMEAWAATEDDPGIAWAEDDAVVSSVRTAATNADLVVVLFHFGHEYHTEPSARQRELARMAVDAGASLVAGSHPHVLQEVEEYRGAVIAYSLGNFVFDGFEGSANESAILSLTFAKDGAVSWSLLPVEIGWDGLPRVP